MLLGKADLQADSDTAMVAAWQVDSQVVVGVGAAQQLETRDDGASHAGTRHTEAAGRQACHRLRPHQQQHHILLAGHWPF